MGGCVPLPVCDTKPWFCVANREGHAPPNLRHKTVVLQMHDLHRANLWLCVAGWVGHAPPLPRHKTTVLCRKPSSEKRSSRFVKSASFDETKHLGRVWTQDRGLGNQFINVKTMAKEQLSLCIIHNVYTYNILWNGILTRCPVQLHFNPACN